MVIYTTESLPQVEIKVILVKEIEEGDCEMELEFVARKEVLWSKKSREFMNKMDPSTQQKYKEFYRTHKSPDPMIIVA